MGLGLGMNWWEWGEWECCQPFPHISASYMNLTRILSRCTRTPNWTFYVNAFKNYRITCIQTYRHTDTDIYRNYYHTASRVVINDELKNRRNLHNIVVVQWKVSRMNCSQMAWSTCTWRPSKAISFRKRFRLTSPRKLIYNLNNSNAKYSKSQQKFI